MKAASFLPAIEEQAYSSPEAGESRWHTPGPKAGPFRVTLGDGSVVTYCWYRFIDQPSLEDADLSQAERDRLQSIVEKIHTQWRRDREYMARPARGTLATLEAALMVTPPPGLEIGYVPIVVRQTAR